MENKAPVLRRYEYATDSPPSPDQSPPESGAGTPRTSPAYNAALFGLWEESGIETRAEHELGRKGFEEIAEDIDGWGGQVEAGQTGQNVRR